VGSNPAAPIVIKPSLAEGFVVLGVFAYFCYSPAWGDTECQSVADKILIIKTLV
jgi:hypothetical protein